MKFYTYTQDHGSDRIDEFSGPLEAENPDEIYKSFASMLAPGEWDEVMTGTRFIVTTKRQGFFAEAKYG